MQNLKVREESNTPSRFFFLERKKALAFVRIWTLKLWKRQKDISLEALVAANDRGGRWVCPQPRVWTRLGTANKTYGYYLTMNLGPVRTETLERYP